MPLSDIDGRLSREDFIRRISTGSANLFDAVAVVVVVIFRRFCCFVNSSIDEYEFESIENEGTEKKQHVFCCC